jgi:hypothetical protein
MLDELKRIALDLKELATPATTTLHEELLDISNTLFILSEDEIMSCNICGDCHGTDNIPLSCKTGDGE